MKSNSKAIGLLKGIGVALALPAVVLIVMELLVFTTQGTHVISSGLDVKNLIRGAGISAAIAFALSMNMTSGRMDLSLGSQRITGTILGRAAWSGRYLDYDICSHFWTGLGLRCRLSLRYPTHSANGTGPWHCLHL